MPVNDLASKWAYMVMAALAWNLKAWYGLLVADRERGLELVWTEFRRFLHAIILLPVQIIRAGRRIGYWAITSADNQDTRTTLRPILNSPPDGLCYFLRNR